LIDELETEFATKTHLASFRGMPTGRANARPMTGSA
jgi:hypothetical protein